ncbi:MAG: 23S rRNA (uracil(1939)-C(5))-methyltransferase RlmD [Microcoleaceae cyanobacterium]
MNNENWQQGQQVELLVTDLSDEGNGVGRYQDRVVFVPDTVPGDRILVKLIQVKPQFAVARLEELLEPSEHRIRPRCIVADKCGGCQWQSVDYDYQLVAKQNQVMQALERIGGFQHPVIDPILPSPASLGYRNKATYPMGLSATGQVQAGYYRKGSHRLVNLNQCPIQDERLNPLLLNIKQDIQQQGWSIYDESRQMGRLRHLSLRMGRCTGEILLTLVVNRPGQGTQRLGREEAAALSTPRSLGQESPRKILVSPRQNPQRSPIAALKKRGVELKGPRVRAYETKMNETKMNETKANEIKTNEIKTNETRPQQSPRQNLRQGSATVVVDSANLPRLETQAQRWLEQYPQLVGVCLNFNSHKSNIIFGEETFCVAGRGYLQEEFAGLIFRLAPETFFQVNPEAAELLLIEIQQELNLQGTEILVDAYCGIGTLTLPLARQVQQAIGLEIQASAIEQANQNASLNTVKNVSFQLGTVEQLLPNLEVHPDIVLLDPPRKGCDPKVIETLLTLQPERIVYISCKPATLARDLKLLCESGVYRLTRVQPADFFPQTSHVECVAFLVKNPVENQADG